jgi:hypothetical protein
MTKLDELLNQFHKQPEALRPELQRIRLSAELTAALHAHTFFKVQGNDKAVGRLALIIQKLTAQLCHEHENKQN